MARILPVLVALGLLIYCTIDCARSREDEIRNLPKAAWLLVIILIPLVGPAAWLLAGRVRPGGTDAPQERPHPTAGPVEPRPVDPRELEEIDEQLRLDQERVDRDYEEALRKWEEEFRREEGDDRP